MSPSDDGAVAECAVYGVHTFISLLYTFSSYVSACRSPPISSGLVQRLICSFSSRSPGPMHVWTTPHRSRWTSSGSLTIEAVGSGNSTTIKKGPRGLKEATTKTLTLQEQGPLTPAPAEITQYRGGPEWGGSCLYFQQFSLTSNTKGQFSPSSEPAALGRPMKETL